MSRRLGALVLTAGFAIAVVAAIGASRSLAAPAAQVTLLHPSAGVAFIVVGVFANSQRSTGRVGLLMIAVGFAWFIPDLTYLPTSLGLTIGILEATLAYAFLAHLFVVFPSGHVRDPLDRAVLAATYAWVLVGNLIPDTLFASVDTACAGCPGNLLVLHRDADSHTVAVAVHQLLNMAIALAVFGLVIRNWVEATPPARRVLRSVAWASGPIVLAVICLNVVGVVGQFNGLTSVTPTLTPLAVMTLPVGFLVALVLAHMAHGSVATLIVDLGGESPRCLRDALAHTLRDPSLALAYPRGDRAGWVDIDGRPVVLPSPGGGRAATLITRDLHPSAVLIHDASLASDPWLLDAAAAAASLALDNERLRADLSAQLEEVRASRARIVAAQDEARRLIERDLHDGAQQRLVAVLLSVEIARDKVRGAGSDGPADLLDEAIRIQREALADLRRLASGIHPAVLTEGGLRPALRALAELAPVDVTLSDLPADRLPEAVEAAAYFMVSETLANVGKHAGAQHATVQVARTNDNLCIEVSDDGVGGAALVTGSGLCGLADRLAALDGGIDVESPPGGGTRVRAVIPCG